MSKYFTRAYWKKKMGAMFYIAFIVLLVHDLVVITGHSLFPSFLPEAQPYILEKITELIISTLTM